MPWDARSWAQERRSWQGHESTVAVYILNRSAPRLTNDTTLSKKVIEPRTQDVRHDDPRIEENIRDRQGGVLQTKRIVNKQEGS